MSYYGVQGQYTKSPTYRHRDGSIDKDPERPLVGYHDTCAHEAFNVDTTGEDWGSWHHDKGMSWGPWLAGVDCEVCGEPC